jgi:hypothetical protein
LFEIIHGIRFVSNSLNNTEQHLCETKALLIYQSVNQRGCHKRGHEFERFKKSILFKSNNEGEKIKQAKFTGRTDCKGDAC